MYIPILLITIVPFTAFDKSSQVTLLSNAVICNYGLFLFVSCYYKAFQL